jgi:hypothetical protein
MIRMLTCQAAETVTIAFQSKIKYKGFSDFRGY